MTDLIETSAHRDAIRDKAEQHFNYFVETATVWQRDKESAELDAVTGMSIVNYVLALAPGDRFVLSEWLATQGGGGDADLKRAFGVLPAICGYLGLLKMKFEFEPFGALPLSVIRALVKTRAPVEYRGVMLTAETVQVAYYRLSVALA